MLYNYLDNQTLRRCANTPEPDRTRRRCPVSRVYPGQVERACLQCGTSFAAYPSYVKRHGGMFCCRSCASTHRNLERAAKGVWEVDWSHPENTGTFVWARNAASHIPKARDWHMTSTATLRRAGVNTPTYRKDSWEVDWTKRNGEKVWARNPESQQPNAREWHWVSYPTVTGSGIAWKPRKASTGRSIDSRGYVVLTRRALTQTDVKLCDDNGLWLGTRRLSVKEHRLVALKKYGELLPGEVVRHLNGNKTDNRPKNLIKGTTQENTRDHDTARLMAMYWREKYEEAQREIERLRGSTPTELIELGCLR